MDNRDLIDKIMKTTIPKKRQRRDEDDDDETLREEAAAYEEEQRQKRVNAGGMMDQVELQEIQRTYQSIQD